jgi:phospholipid transport system transporter-binding protein
VNATALVNRKDGYAEIHGELTFDTVPSLCERSAAMMQGDYPVVTVDMGHVSRADSAGLALMVQWLRLARTANRQLQFISVPEQVRQLIRVSGLDEAFSVK